MCLAMHARAHAHTQKEEVVKGAIETVRPEAAESQAAEAPEAVYAFFFPMSRRMPMANAEDPCRLDGI